MDIVPLDSSAHVNKSKNDKAANAAIAFESVLNQKVAEVYAGAITPAEELYKQKFRERKEQIEKGKLFQKESEKEDTVLQTFSKLKKCLRTIIKLEQMLIGL